MTNESRPLLLPGQLEESRPQLVALAQRMLGSRSEAEDAVQETWLRASRADSTTIDNLRGWLTSVLARVCLDMLRSRKNRPESSAAEAVERASDGATSPEHDTLLADSVGLALLVVLDVLTPNERLAFVLHDVFDVPFEEIALVVDVSPAAARQLASRARRRVRGGRSGAAAERADPERQKQVVQAFLTASRSGDLASLLAVLDPHVVLRCDPHGVAQSLARRDQGAPVLAPETRGAAAVAAAFSRRAGAAQLAVIAGAFGAVWAPDGQPRAAFALTIVEGKIAAIDIVSAPAALARLQIDLI